MSQETIVSNIVDEWIKNDPGRMIVIYPTSNCDSVHVCAVEPEDDFPDGARETEGSYSDAIKKLAWYHLSKKGG